MALVDLDPRTNTEDRLELLGETQSIIVGNNYSKTTTMARGLESEMEREIRSVLWRNKDLFAWTVADMSGIHPSVMSHKLALFKAQPVAQKKRRIGEEKMRAVEEEVNGVCEPTTRI